MGRHTEEQSADELLRLQQSHRTQGRPSASYSPLSLLGFFFALKLPCESWPPSPCGKLVLAGPGPSPGLVQRNPRPGMARAHTSGRWAQDVRGAGPEVRQLRMYVVEALRSQVESCSRSTSGASTTMVCTQQLGTHRLPAV